MQSVEYKYLGLLDLLHTSLMLASLALVHRMAEFVGFSFSLSSIIFPMTFVITNLIARVYGYQYAHHTMWRGIMAQIPFSLIVMLSSQFDYPDSHNYESFYHYVFGGELRVTLACIIGAWLGYKMNIFVLSRSDYLLQQRWFSLINFGACGIGEMTFTLFALPIMFLGEVSFSTLLTMMMISLLIKVVYSALFCVPSGTIAKILEQHEPKSRFHQQIFFKPAANN